VVRTFPIWVDGDHTRLPLDVDPNEEATRDAMDVIGLVERRYEP
jgi:hypothetical protein